jgi:hypothetical protein
VEGPGWPGLGQEREQARHRYAAGYFATHRHSASRPQDPVVLGVPTALVQPTTLTARSACSPLDFAGSIWFQNCFRCRLVFAGRGFAVLTFRAHRDLWPRLRATRSTHFASLPGSRQLEGGC